MVTRSKSSGTAIDENKSRLMRHKTCQAISFRTQICSPKYLKLAITKENITES